jgi:uncharacterized protein (DUF983 family)
MCNVYGGRWKGACDCPRCGEGRLFRGPFSMHDRCAVCHLTFEREPGYFVGAIYINYAVTAILTISGFLLVDHYADLALEAEIALWSLFGIAFPLFFFRHSKSFWLALDHLVDPEEPTLRIVRDRRA